MRQTTNYQLALGHLREALAALKLGGQVYDTIVAPESQVLARYQPIFSLDHLDSLSPEEFNSFLYFENNHHWSGLYRQGLRASEDIRKLRTGLGLLLDESQPIAKRVDDSISMIPGMGKAIATAILLVAFPQKYGVWNSTSEAAMRQAEIWPKFERGTTLGEKYERVNEILAGLSQDLGTDLWTLDAIWWKLISEDELPKGSATIPQPSVLPSPSPQLPPDAQRFALERHLQDFLLDNWPRTELGADWMIYSEDGDDEAGYEYPTDVGRIDLLAKHRQDPRWLVVELKRDQTSDATVGQVLRYMGWIKLNRAKQNEKVEGLVIAHEADEAIRYALSAMPEISLMLYEVEFRLSLVANMEVPVRE